MQSRLLLDDLAAQLDDALNLEHDLHLCEWFADRGEQLPAHVRDALDVHAQALVQAEATRQALSHCIRAAELQQVAA